MQWAYGVTCWEIFTGGKVPYASVNLAELSRLLVNGHCLEKPSNDACSDEMWAPYNMHNEITMDKCMIVHFTVEMLLIV